MTSSGEHDRRWTFVTNHALVLAYIAKEPHARLRDVAHGVGVTERTAAQIVNDLEQAGYLTKTRNVDGNQDLDRFDEPQFRAANRDSHSSAHRRVPARVATRSGATDEPSDAATP